MYLIGDELTVTGLQLAGLKKAVKANPSNVASMIKQVPDNQEIILITQSLSQHASAEIDMLRRKGIIVIEIPDNSGTGGEDITRKLVREAVGFDLKT